MKQEGEARKGSAAGKIKVQKQLGLHHAIAVIVGAIIGSGIFISPVGVVKNVQSVGMSLVIWAFCGIHHMCLAFCYAELGTLMPHAGGDYIYIYESLGPVCAFLDLWIVLIMQGPVSLAIQARASAIYLLPVFFNNEAPPVEIATLFSVWLAILFGIVNVVSVKWAAKTATLLSTAKVLALVLIMGVGLAELAQGRTENFQDAFAGTVWDPGAIALAIYGGGFSFNGWEYIGVIAEEMKNPVRDIPLTIVISLSTVTAVYVLANMAYFTILTPMEFLASDAVALTFGVRTLGGVFVIFISIFVFMSTSGTINSYYMIHPRCSLAGQRNDQLPAMFGLLSFKYFTPVIAIVVLFIISIFYLLLGDLDKLMDYMVLTHMMKQVLAILGLFYLRWKKPELHRTVKVNLIVAVVNFLILLALMGLGTYQDPLTNGIGFAILIAGLPVFFLGKFLARPGPHSIVIDKITLFLQLIFLAVPETEKLTTAIDQEAEEEKTPLLAQNTSLDNTQNDQYKALPAMDYGLSKTKES